MVAAAVAVVKVLVRRVVVAAALLISRALPVVAAHLEALVLVVLLVREASMTDTAVLVVVGVLLVPVVIPRMPRDRGLDRSVVVVRRAKLLTVTPTLHGSPPVLVREL